MQPLRIPFTNLTEVKQIVSALATLWRTKSGSWTECGLRTHGTICLLVEHEGSTPTVPNATNNNDPESVSVTSHPHNFFLMTLQPLWTLAAFQFSDLFTIGRTPWTSDQLIARPLPKHRREQTQNKHIRVYTPNIHALSGIRTYDHSVRASENSSCLRPIGYRDRPIHTIYFRKIHPSTNFPSLVRTLKLYFPNSASLSKHVSCLLPYL
jgi:hypothetical protein